MKKNNVTVGILNFLLHFVIKKVFSRFEWDSF